MDVELALSYPGSQRKSARPWVHGSKFKEEKFIRDPGLADFEHRNAHESSRSEFFSGGT